MNVHAKPISITRIELFFPVNCDVVEVFANAATISSALADRKDVGASAISALVFRENPNLSECANAMHLRKLKEAAKVFNGAFFANWVSDDAVFVEDRAYRVGYVSYHFLKENFNGS